MRFSSLRGSPMSARPLGPRGSSDRARVEGSFRHALAQEHADPVFFIHVRLVGGPAPVQVVQVETGRPEIHQRLKLRRGQSLAQVGNRIEGKVVVDELSEVGIGRRYSLVLFGIIPMPSCSGSSGAIITRASSSRSRCLKLAVGRYGNSLVNRPSITSSSRSSFVRSHHVPCLSNDPDGEGSDDWGSRGCRLLCRVHRRTVACLFPGTLERTGNPASAMGHKVVCVVVQLRDPGFRRSRDYRDGESFYEFVRRHC